MNTVVTSKEEILKTSRELIRREGWSAVNIRSVAAGCGVSVGSIYNYFDSKADLVGAVVESVWCEIFHRPEDAAVFRDTQACIIWLYGRMEYGSKQYPGFFALHPAGFAGEDPSDGKKRMQQAWQHMLDGLWYCFAAGMPTSALDAFTEHFRWRNLADLLFSLMLSAFAAAGSMTLRLYWK